MPPENLSSKRSLAALTAPRLVIVAGKGGVGKTTVTAVVARAARDSGRRVLVVELDGRRAIDRLIPDIEVLHLSAGRALEEYLLDHGFRRVAKRLVSTGVIEIVGTAAPGIDDLVVLGKIKQLERSGQWDLIIVDGPAAGHAVTFLTSAAGLLDSVSSGPVADQAGDVVAMLSDPQRCHTVLVTLPETTPVNELLETAARIGSEVGVALGPVVVNQVDDSPGVPDPSTITFGSRTRHRDAVRQAAEFQRARRAVEDTARQRLDMHLTGAQVVIPRLATSGLDAADVVNLAQALTADTDGAANSSSDAAPTTASTDDAR